VSEPATYSYPRYLKAKRTVDARALNRRVWSRFVDELAARGSSPVRVLEVGGGVGATVERIVEALASRSVGALDYTFVDIEPENVEAARTGLRTWAEGRGYSVSEGAPQVWTGGPVEVTVRFAAADLFDVADAHEGPAHDVLVAQAVLDLMDISGALGALAPLLAPDALWYLPIHFDGVTALEPRVDSGLDARVERLFHESMAGPAPAGERSGAHCGRRLLRHLHDSEAALLEAGSSDWVVVPQEGGGYPGDEAYFLHHILHFIETELTGHPELDAGAFADWVATRRRQVETGRLIYIAHQLDALARSP
jgi:hypothetical protein